MFKKLVKGFGLVKDFSDAREWLGKRWFLSKTLWVNIIAYLASEVLPVYFQFTLSGTDQVAVLATLNIILRLVTKQPLVMKEESIIRVGPPDTSGNGLSGN